RHEHDVAVTAAECGRESEPDDRRDGDADRRYHPDRVTDRSTDLSSADRDREHNVLTDAIRRRRRESLRGRERIGSASREWWVRFHPDGGSGGTRGAYRDCDDGGGETGWRDVVDVVTGWLGGG